jgi:hypothetical protein
MGGVGEWVRRMGDESRCYAKSQRRAGSWLDSWIKVPLDLLAMWMGWIAESEMSVLCCKDTAPVPQFQ